MHIERLVLVGAGGHAKVVLDAFRSMYPNAVVEARDDDAAKRGSKLLGVTIETPIGTLAGAGAACHVAIGHNAIRRRIAENIGATLVSVFHPRAIVAVDARVGRGVFVAAGGLIAPDAAVGDGTIVNHNAVIDHDCVVGAWCHIAPGALLGGGVSVGDECLIGSGAVILAGVKIGARAIVGAGAVVTRDVADGAKIAGVPAKDL